MNNLAAFLIVPCVTFGPLFLTNIAGTSSADMRWLGSIMLAIGLGGMLRMIQHQQKQIQNLQQSSESRK